MTATERSRRYRDKQRAAGESYRDRAAHHVADRARKRRRTQERPFMGVDGEGAGVDELGRQHYRLLTAHRTDDVGDHGAELFTGSPLSTVECLEFITSLPAQPILVGFALGYDATQIFRDIPPDRLARIFADKPASAGHSRYTWFDDYGVEYLARNYLRVCRTRKVWVMRDGKWLQTRQSIPGSARTIYDTFAFFQTSFLKAITAWGIGTEDERAEIQANKDARASFVIDDRVRAYCQRECSMLAEMMEAFRLVCTETDLRPKTWSGAGKLSAALHTQFETITRAELAELIPPELSVMASHAYYGGRFEITRAGSVAGPIHEYDIRSAYPAAMPDLPCLRHGTWTQASGKTLAALPAGTLYVAAVRFRHDPPPGQSQALCGLPVRQKTGRIFWPMQGNGTYWSTEIEAAKLLNCTVRHRDGWIYRKNCDCRQFGWIPEKYKFRQSLGSSTRGFPIKLGINGAYGKLAQRVGQPKWANPVWAGLITAATRATLIRAAATDPSAIVMLATDGIFSLRPLPLTIGEDLGQWETKGHDRMFIVQPGIYWGASKPKTRGVGASFFTNKTDLFETAWARYAEEDKSALNNSVIPKVALDLTLFIGSRLALARGKPNLAGSWITRPREFSFDWHGKRGYHNWDERGMVTHPAEGSPGLQSHHYRTAELAPVMDAMDLDRLELDDQPDYFDLSPPWRD